MKIVHIISSLGIGGAQVTLAQLVHASCARGDDVSVITFSHDESMRHLFPESGVSLAILPIDGGRSVLKTLICLRHMIADMQPDVVQTWLYHADLITALSVLFMRRRFRLIWTLRCMDLLSGNPRLDYRLMKRLLPWLSKSVDLVIANAHASRDDYRKLGYAPRAWQVIENGIDTARFQPDPLQRQNVRSQLQVEADIPLLVFVGRDHPVKGFSIFADALRRVTTHSTHPPCTVVLAGPGVVSDNNRLQSMFSNLGEITVRLIGVPDDIQGLYQAADIIVSASLSEGFPTVVGEAMSSGVVPIVTDVGDSARVVGDVGIVVPAQDPDSLAEAILTLLCETTDKRAVRATEVRRRIVSEFPMARAQSRFMEIYGQSGHSQCVA